jgi:hypothetical protein
MFQTTNQQHNDKLWSSATHRSSVLYLDRHLRVSASPHGGTSAEGINLAIHWSLVPITTMAFKWLKPVS